MRYGTVNSEYAADLAGREPATDRPIFMVNFMKYRAVADYSDRSTGVEFSGMEADDKYAPTEVLADIGADVAFFGRVVAQGSADEWDRMGIVRYPTRRSFIEMQSRRDFKEKHVHKEAGMDYTIVCGGLPAAAHRPIERRGYVTFRLAAGPPTAQPSESQAVLSIEGTILGDGRSWNHLVMTWSDDVPAVAEIEHGGDQLLVVAHAEIDRMGKLLTSPGN
ncbi:MAG: hypothetical protein ACKOJC_09070 [Actinomycetota bacterium]